jgi:UDP-GlcNAc:undecaprenyl-phosphate/decaprenyl-phosphate GlcNAc-1-phosphate transferase
LLFGRQGQPTPDKADLMPVLPEYLVTPILAFCVAAAVMPLLNRLALRLGFVDLPNARKIHSSPIPLLGGLAVYAGVVVALVLRGWIDWRIWMMMGAALLVMLLGVADDRLDLHSRYRLALQVLIAAALSFAGVRFHLFPMEALDHIVTILWIVGVVNAMNCIDCADGAAGGTCLVVFAAIAVMAGMNGRFFICQAALAGAGAVVGFLVYNVPPARVFLGDAGSTFLGLMIAVLAILTNRTPTGDWHVPVAPLMLFVPVFDIAWVHYRRYQAGIRRMRDLLSSTGKDHLPHRLMVRGLGKPACMAVVALLTGFACVSACLMAAGFWMPAAMCLVMLIAVLWHLEENARVVIRPGDQVALYEVRDETPVLQTASHPEESLA